MTADFLDELYNERQAYRERRAEYDTRVAAYFENFVPKIPHTLYIS